MLYGSIIDMKNILNRYVNMINDGGGKMRDVLIIGSWTSITLLQFMQKSKSGRSSGKEYEGTGQIAESPCG